MPIHRAKSRIDSSLSRKQKNPTGCHQWILVIRSSINAKKRSKVRALDGLADGGVGQNRGADDSGVDERQRGWC
jgi:hypothetical protein